MRRLIPFLLLSFLLASPSFVSTARAALTEADLDGTGLNPPAGAALPPDLPLLDEAGLPTTPARALAGRPALLVMADLTCEALCGTALGLAAAALDGTGLRPGGDYVFLVLGIDPRDGAAEAAAMRDTYLAGFPAVMREARFLTGGAEALARAEAAIGYTARLDPESDRYAHPLGALVLTPAGAVSRVLPGIALQPEAVGPALREAASGAVAGEAGGGVLSGLRLFCYGLEPARGIYDAIVKRGLVAGTAATTIALAVCGLLLARRGRRA